MELVEVGLEKVKKFEVLVIKQETVILGLKRKNRY